MLLRPKTRKFPDEVTACEESFDEVCDRVERLRETRFDLNSIKMPRFDDQILQMDWLTHIHLFSNELESLPDSISLLKNLESLSVTSNLLTALPAGIGGLTKLTKLDVNHNQLTELPVEFGNLVNLQVLLLNEVEVGGISQGPSGIKEVGLAGTHKGTEYWQTSRSLVQQSYRVDQKEKVRGLCNRGHEC